MQDLSCAPALCIVHLSTLGIRARTSKGCKVRQGTRESPKISVIEINSCEVRPTNCRKVIAQVCAFRTRSGGMISVNFDVSPIIVSTYRRCLGNLLMSPMRRTLLRMGSHHLHPLAQNIRSTRGPLTAANSGRPRTPNRPALGLLFRIEAKQAAIESVASAADAAAHMSGEMSGRNRSPIASLRRLS
jgi:hypothetical protein